MFKIARLALVACLAVAVTGVALGTPGGPKLESFATSTVAFDTVKIKPPAGDVHHPKSFFGTIDAKGVGFTYLNDGHKGLGSLNLDLIGTFGGKFALNAMTVIDPSSKSTIWEGLGGTYKLYDKGGLAASVVLGWKGLQITNGIGTNYQHPFVVGIQATIPFSTH